MSIPAELKGVLVSTADTLGGSIRFEGTRVPVQALLETLEAGYGLDYFLDGWPDVTAEQAKSSSRSVRHGLGCLAVRVLLDNCVNHRFSRFLEGFEVVHVRSLGLGALTNGKLLSAAENVAFDVLLTVDQNVRMQQNMTERTINLITLDTRSILLESLVPFVPGVRAAL